MYPDGETCGERRVGRQRSKERCNDSYKLRDDVARVFVRTPARLHLACFIGLAGETARSDPETAGPSAKQGRGIFPGGRGRKTASLAIHGCAAVHSLN